MESIPDHLTLEKRYLITHFCKKGLSQQQVALEVGCTNRLLIAGHRKPVEGGDVCYIQPQTKCSTYYLVAGKGNGTPPVEMAENATFWHCITQAQQP